MNERKLPIWSKVVISGALLLHLAAVFAPPFHFATERSSPLSAPLFSGLQPYVDFMYLDHGYFFFAPEPGPSHLMRWELELASGAGEGESKQIQQTFPDRQEQWPRLLYHRHFMLSEWLQVNAPPGDLPLELRQTDQYRRSERFYLDIRRSYSRHLQKKHSAEDARVTRVRHMLPALDQFLREKPKLTDKRSYMDLYPEPTDSVAASDREELSP